MVVEATVVVPQTVDEDGRETAASDETAKIVEPFTIVTTSSRKVNDLNVPIAGEEPVTEYILILPTLAELRARGLFISFLVEGRMHYRAPTLEEMKVEAAVVPEMVLRQDSDYAKALLGLKVGNKVIFAPVDRYLVTIQAVDDVKEVSLKPKEEKTSLPLSPQVLVEP